ncbi:MAG: DUF86 domain-containing protein [Bacillota bacterium]|nr:DUF86 domain-containing protein [Bacillota bacterium]
MVNDVMLNKCSVIERCLKRVCEEYAGSPCSLQNFTKQDSIVLNLVRICEASIDLAMHVVSEQRLGIPQSSRDAFEILRQCSILSDSTATAMKNMVGFRNIAVHDYQAMSLEIVQAIVEGHLGDFRTYINELMVHVR